MKNSQKAINYVLSHEVEFVCPKCEVSMPGLPSSGTICGGCGKQLDRKEILQKETRIFIKATQKISYTKEK